MGYTEGKGGDIMTYLIFLRGLNTGKLRITMPQLKKILAHRHFTRVETVLATGNLIIESSLTAAEVETILTDLLAAHFQQPLAFVIRTKETLQAILSKLPAESDNRYNQMILFCVTDLYPQLQAEYQAVAPKDGSVLQRLTGNDLYWRVLKGSTTQGFGKILGDKKYQQQLTSRNKNTLAKVLAKV